MKSDGFYIKVRDDIEREGHSIIGVFDEINTFYYTIGLTDNKLPELLVYGQGVSLAYILNSLAALMRDRGIPFDNGERVSLGGKHPVMIVEAGSRAKEDYTIQVGRYYEIEDSEYRVQQVLICDHEGRFPGEPGCAPPYSLAPILT